MVLMEVLCYYGSPSTTSVQDLSAFSCQLLLSSGEISHAPLPRGHTVRRIFGWIHSVSGCFSPSTLPSIDTDGFQFQQNMQLETCNTLLYFRTPN